MSYLTRLILLYVAVIGFIVGGYWSVSHDIDQSFSDAWVNGTSMAYHFDCRVAYEAVVLWVVTAGRRFFLIEVPKRFIFFFVAPSFIIWLLPKKWHRWIRHRYARIKTALIESKGRFMNWFRIRMFGPYTAHALALIAAAVFFLLFYSLFWTYLALWLGFIRVPSFVKSFFGFLWRRMLFTAEKVPFVTLVFKYGARVSEWVDDQIPQVRWTPTPESKRNRERKLARRAILLRYRRDHLLEQISFSTYRKVLAR